MCREHITAAEPARKASRGRSAVEGYRAFDRGTPLHHAAHGPPPPAGEDLSSIIFTALARWPVITSMPGFRSLDWTAVLRPSLAPVTTWIGCGWPLLPTT